MRLHSETEKRFSRSAHCVLCGEQFYCDLPFISLIADESQQHKDSIRLASVVPYQKTKLLNGKYELRDEGDYPVAPSLHSICWKALKNKNNLESIFCFGLAMVPLLDVEVKGNIYASSNTYFLSEALQRFCRPTYKHPAQKSNLFHDLNQLGALPEEIISLVWEYLSPTVVRCLLSLQTSMDLIERVSPIRQWSATFLLHGSMTVFFRHLHGETYICGLNNTYQQYGYKSHDCQQVQIEMPVVAVSAIIGLFGLKGIQYLMKDGTEGYIGPPIRRIGYTRCMNILSHNLAEPLFLRVEGDGFKIRTIRRHQSSIPCFGDLFTWDPHCPIGLLYLKDEASFFLHPRQKDYTKNTNKLFMRHVPFMEKGATMYGLTVSCSRAGGIIGLGTHFHRYSEAGIRSSYSTWQGQYKGCILHIRLQPKEQITAIWVLSCKSGFFDYPYLGVITSERRSYTLAPQMLRSQTNFKLLAEESRGAVLGMYYDNSPGAPARISSFGVFCSSAAARMHSPASTPLFVPSLRYGHPGLEGSVWEQFSSQATLENVSSLEICCLGVRCTGMILTYLDGHQRVLGQWREYEPSKHAIIRTLGPIYRQGLRFYLANNHGYSYLERVELKSHESEGPIIHTPAQTVVDVNYADEITWLFSHSSDVIFSEGMQS